MKPTFTGSYVFHYMQPEEGTPGCVDPQDFEEMSGGFSHDREYERHGIAYNDDGNECIGEAARDLLLEHLPSPLRDGDYVMVTLAGTMNYHVYTDWESGGTECDLCIEPEWHSIRVMDAEERRIHDDENDIMPAGVPLALYTEYSPYAFEFPKSPPSLWDRLKVPTRDPLFAVPPMVAPPLTRCAADRDGDCDHVQCPQLRDGEPKATGRSCPIACWDVDD